MPDLQADPRIATAGYYRLQWQPPPGSRERALEYEVEEARDPAFDPAVTLYRGSDLATVASGRSDGVRYYRVRVRNARTGEMGPWSRTVAVETRHHSLARALAFFSIGALVFLLTLALILRGAGRPEARSPARG